MSTDTLDIQAVRAFAGFTLNLDTAIPLSGCTAVFGPSGSGKSTLLRLIAGFERPDHGRIVHRGETWCDTGQRQFIAPHRRRVGMVFQDGRLFPHLSAGDNLGYAETRSAGGHVRARFDDMVDAFDLSDLLDRKPDTLSGGERQRIALARTLLTQPDLLLLDEPLSALDRTRKSAILPYLDDLPGRFGVPAIYVSHSIDEVARLADRTIIMRDGQIRATGRTADMLNAHAAAPGEGETTVTVLEGTVAGHEPELALTRVAVADSQIAVPMAMHKPVGARVNLRIDARNIALATAEPAGLSIRNILPAALLDITGAPTSAFVTVRLQVAGALLSAQVTRAAVADLGLEPGQAVFALVKSASFDL